MKTFNQAKVVEDDIFATVKSSILLGVFVAECTLGLCYIGLSLAMLELSFTEWRPAFSAVLKSQQIPTCGLSIFLTCSPRERALPCICTCALLLHALKTVHACFLLNTSSCMHFMVCQFQPSHTFLKRVARSSLIKNCLTAGFGPFSNKLGDNSSLASEELCIYASGTHTSALWPHPRENSVLVPKPSPRSISAK